MSTQTQHINSNFLMNSLPEQSDNTNISTSFGNMSSVLPESIPGTENFVAVNSVENFLASLYANPQVHQMLCKQLSKI